MGDSEGGGYGSKGGCEGVEKDVDWYFGKVDSWTLRGYDDGHW